MIAKTDAQAGNNPRLVAIVVLLGLATIINYIDRGNLSIAAPLIKKELHVSATQLGFLLTAFFITYMPMQLLVGWLVDRFAASRVLVAGFSVWSLATVLSAFAPAFGTLFGCRLLLGAGESVTFPSLTRILAENATEKQRCLATGVPMAGTALGPALGVFLGAIAVAAFGWRPFFIACGIISFLWIAAWVAIAHAHVRQRVTSRSSGSPPITLILKEPSLWGASLGQFCETFVVYFILAWIPYYLVNERHWTLPQMGTIAGSAYVLVGASTIAFGALSDRFIRAGASPTIVRKAAFGIGGAGVAVCMLGSGYSNDVDSAIWLILNGVPLGLLILNIFVVVQTLAGAEVAGRWAGLQNTLASVAGLIAPSLTGILVDRTGSFALPFTIAAVMALASGAAWVLLVGPMKRIDWAARLPTVDTAAAPIARQ